MIRYLNLAWARRDPIIVVVLFIILSVLSVTTTITSNKSLENTDRVKQILESTDILQAQQEFFSNLSRVSAFCTLITSGAVNTGEIPFEAEAIEAYHTQCVMDRTGPPPTTTITTE